MHEIIYLHLFITIDLARYTSQDRIGWLIPALIALLARHKRYMQDAERHREEMNSRHEQLELEKRALECQNEKTLETNRRLFDQQEKLNLSVAQSEIQIKALETTLDSTRYEFKRLQTLAARTHHLENQLVALEREREILQCTIWTTKELKHKAEQRWRAAERRLVSLQEQLESIDRESKEERERHVGLLKCMSKRCDLKKELGLIEGRMNDEIADLEVSKSRSKNILPHFVEDIIQDNANLQSGISELRDMLLCSNEEAQMLREQLIEYKKLGGPDSRHENLSLGAELSQKDAPQPSVINQSIHTHHHYHIPPRRRESYKFRRKSGLLNSGLYKPRRNLKSRHKRQESELSPTFSNSTSILESSLVPGKRWSEKSSLISDFASSSRPSTPHSFHTHSGLFDRGLDYNSSFPTSFESSDDQISPTFRSVKSFTQTSKQCYPSFLNLEDDIIQEENGANNDDSDLNPQSSKENFTSPMKKPFGQENLEYTSSHEPIISIDSIEIHTLTSCPSQNTSSRPNTLVSSLSCYGMPTLMTDSKTFTSASAIMARPILTPKGHKNISKNLSNILSRYVDTCPDHGSRSTTKIKSWIRDHWGRGPTQVTRSLFTSHAKKQIARLNTYRQNRKNAYCSKTSLILRRSPGINQKGLVPGFFKKSKRLPCQTLPVSVDYDALREVLFEEFSSLTV